MFCDESVDAADCIDHQTARQRSGTRRNIVDEGERPVKKTQQETKPNLSFSVTLRQDGRCLGHADLVDLVRFRLVASICSRWGRYACGGF